MIWNEQIFKEMAKVAARAPSVHNVQPWKIQFTEDGFNLFQSHNRRLFVGDPRLHDNDVSLGCFLELCRMFLETVGIGMILQKEETQKKSEENDTYEMRFAIFLTEIPVHSDPLYKLIEKRRAYRGTFDYDKDFNEKNLEDIKVPGIELKWLTGPDHMKEWSKKYDHTSVEINKQPGYFKELIHWLRFSESDPNFFQDGLNRKALSLNSFEGTLGKLLFKESVFKILNSIGMAEALITEAPQIKSAQGILIVYADKKLSSLEAGRGFVRFWLELTGKNLYACPLSALVDFTQTRDILNSMKPSDAMIPLNVLRFGKVADEKKIYSSPRLDVDRIIIK